MIKTYPSIRFSIGLLSFVLFLYTGVIHAQVPDFSYAKTAGAGGDERGNSICTDTDGNSYTIGTFNGEVDFNPSPSATHMLGSFGDDVFVLKLNSNGDFVWAIRIGDSGTDEGNGITLDEDNNLVITGSFEQDVDFDPGSGTTILSSVELRNIFIAKLDADANLIWAKSIGDTGYDAGNSIATDPTTGNIYVTGYFEYTVDFDPNAGTFPLTADGSLDGFIVNLYSNGDFQWAAQFGNDEDDQGDGIAITETGRICVTGSIGYEESNDDRHSSIFIAQYCPSGGSPFWEKQIGYADNGSYHAGTSIATDDAGNVFVTGEFYNTMDFDPGTGTYILNGGNYELAFILKLERDGTFAWAHEFSAWESEGSDVEVDADGNVWVLGDTNPEGPWSTFIAVFDTEGESLFYDEFGNDCLGNSLAISTAGNIFVTGSFSSTSDFDFSSEVTELTPNGGSDIYIMKLGGAPPEPVDEDLEIFNFISANGDETNSRLFIQNVDASEDTRNNTATIFNRWGDVVWDTKNYDNIDRAFKGNTNNGNELPTGTYYYKIEFSGGKKRTGFLSLRR